MACSLSSLHPASHPFCSGPAMTNFILKNELLFLLEVLNLLIKVQQCLSQLYKAHSLWDQRGLPYFSPIVNRGDWIEGMVLWDGTTKKPDRMGRPPTPQGLATAGCSRHPETEESPEAGSFQPKLEVAGFKAEMWLTTAEDAAPGSREAERRKGFLSSGFAPQSLASVFHWVTQSFSTFFLLSSPQGDVFCLIASPPPPNFHTPDRLYIDWCTVYVAVLYTKKKMIFSHCWRTNFYACGGDLAPIENGWQKAAGSAPLRRRGEPREGEEGTTSRMSETVCHLSSRVSEGLTGCRI